MEIFKSCKYAFSPGSTTPEVEVELSDSLQGEVSTRICRVLIELVEKLEGELPVVFEEPAQLVDPMSLVPGPVPQTVSEPSIRLTADDVYSCVPEHLRAFVQGQLHIWVQDDLQKPGGWYRVVYEAVPLTE